MATNHNLSKLILSKDHSECFWSNTKVWGELEKLGANSTKVGANSTKVGANSKYKFYSRGELAMGRNRYQPNNGLT